MVPVKPDVSIIIPCRNEAQYIESCVRSILAQEAPGVDFEVLVADGMSDDGTRDILARLADIDPRLRIVDNPQQIVSTGLNLGIRAARGSVIVRIDVHTKYARDYLSQCLSVLRETGADNVGGPWVARGEGLIGEAVATAFQSRFAMGGGKAHDPNYEGTVDTVYLGCWPRQVFDRIGLFDEELVRSQDDEFNLRLLRAGGKIWQSPRIKSWYRSRESLGEVFRQWAQYGYWKIRVIQKHKLPASVRQIVPGGFLLCCGIGFITSVWWPPAMLGWLSLATLYAACNIIASFLTAAGQGWKLFPILPIVFACYHFGHGYGFLRGILDFVILRHGAVGSFTRLTRLPGNLQNDGLPKETR
jgi:succinoglycan biosynthesis protein ExoA